MEAEPLEAAPYMVMSTYYLAGEYISFDKNILRYTTDTKLHLHLFISIFFTTEIPVENTVCTGNIAVKKVYEPFYLST